MDPGNASALLYLSSKRTMYMGQLAPVLEQACAASTLIFSMNDHLNVVDNKTKESHRGRSFLIPPGAHVTIHTQDSPIGLCFLDTLGVDLAILKKKMRCEIPLNQNMRLFCGVANEDRVIESAYGLLSNKADAKTAFAALDCWIGQPDQHTHIPEDPRVTKAVALVKDSVLENRSVEDIAKELNLSLPRLSQLFKQITGIPIRRFRLWHRIFIVAMKMAWGMSLTEAAVSSGFSDSAHFSRTFKEIGGVKPSVVLSAKRHTFIQILQEHEAQECEEDNTPQAVLS